MENQEETDQDLGCRVERNGWRRAFMVYFHLSQRHIPVKHFCQTWSLAFLGVYREQQLTLIAMRRQIFCNSNMMLYSKAKYFIHICGVRGFVFSCAGTFSQHPSSITSDQQLPAHNREAQCSHNWCCARLQGIINLLYS